MPNYDIALKEFDERFIGNISKKYYDYLNQVMFKDVDAKHYFKNTGDYGIIHKLFRYWLRIRDPVSFFKKNRHTML